MPKVSVIVAAYNCQEYIKECIRSIQEQTFTDWELIICDDASTDGTWDIIRKLAKQDFRIKLIRNDKNMFAAVSRNKCIDLSVGEYIAIQDADDFSSPVRLERQISFLEENPDYSFVGTGSYLLDNNGVWGRSYKKEKPEKKDFLFALPFVHASLCIKKIALMEIKCYRVSNETRRVEDYEMIMNLYSKNYIGYNLKETLYYYRVDQNTLNRRKYKYRIDEALIRYKSFRKLGLMPKGYIYVMKPLIVGLLPAKLLYQIKNKY